MKLIGIILTLFILKSCFVGGPNYNTKRSHNANLRARDRIIRQQDRKINREMKNIRKRTLRYYKKKTTK